MNMLERCAYRDDENRENRKDAQRRIDEGKESSLRFILNAIDKLQNAVHDLRFALKTSEVPARLELKYVDFLYWDDMNRNIDDLRKAIYNFERLAEYMIEALRMTYDSSKANEKIDWEKVLCQLRYAIAEITPEIESLNL